MTCHKSGCAVKVTYELSDASPCKAAEAGQIALGAKFDRGFGLILEDLYIVSTRPILEAAVNGLLHQYRGPSYWRRLCYIREEGEWETGRARLCGLCARGRVVEKGSLESWPEIALLAPACVSWSAEPACGALIMSCR